MEARLREPHPGRRAAALCLLLLGTGGAQAQQTPDAACGPLQNAFGPYDYRVERGKSLELVESAHFTSEVESLLRGRGGPLGGDLDYTLRAFPNHHRALLSTMRYGERTNPMKPPHMRYSVECYFLRALSFRPDDTTARLLYATYLHRAGRVGAMQNELERATELAGNNALTHYNIGLLYLEANDPGRALRQARRALALGHPRQELKERLVAAGRWRDAPPEPPRHAASPAARSSSSSSSSSGGDDEAATGADDGRSASAAAPAHAQR